MTETQGPFRLVWRTDQNMIRLWPGVIEGVCSRCGESALIDSNQPAPPGMEDAALICVPCALADPELRPEVRKIYQQVRAATATW